MTPARLAAARALVALDRGHTTLAAEVERSRPDLADARDRALFLEIVNGSVRWQAELDACLNARSTRPIQSLAPEVRAVLRLGAYQLLHLDRVPAHAVVNESVVATRSLRQPGAAGFVNAVLRGLLREKDPRGTLPARPADPGHTEAALAYLSVTLSHPRWLVARWLARESFESVERWCRFNNASPDVTIRPLPGVSADACRERLASAGIETAPGLFVPDALRLAPGALGLVPEDVRRDVIIQDEGAQIVALAVGATRGECVLDACAAPGGKTLMLCDHVGAQGRVIAGDHRPARVALLRATLTRADQTVAARAHALAIDATASLPFAPVFDRVLLDAPCSGLGTLRRDPDLKWTRTAADFGRLTATQGLMIAHVADVVRPGGSLVYATCSSEPEENDRIVDAFLAARPDFTLEPVTFGPGLSALSALVDARGLLRTVPPRDRLDAFFAARLVRQQTA